MTYDLIIIGGGPGGYEMAAAAAAAGLKVALVERDHLGGTCLNRGCIPTKALCRSAEVVSTVRDAQAWGVSTGDVTVDYAAAVARKDQVVSQLRDGVAMLMQQGGITVVQGEARFVDAHTIGVGDDTLTASHVVIATGSAPRGLPIEGADLAISSDELLATTTLPGRLCVVGGGVIGMEFAGIISAYGVDVTVVEYCKEILPPFDKDIAKRLRSVMSKRGVKIVTQAAVKSLAKGDDGIAVAYETKGKETTVMADAVLLSVGRQPVLPPGLEHTAVEVTRRGIAVDEHMQTREPGIYAIGDVNGLCMLAHAASAQGMVALNHILGKPCDIDLSIIPSAVFTTPELAMVGLTEEQCAEQGLTVDVKKAFFRSNGKALAMGETDGLVKMIVDSATRKIVGCHICGAHAADLIQEVATTMCCGATVDAMASAIHGHPTLGEVLQAVARQF
ncbi:MAG: dihydrolipoyl dehydrogenase [Muribaculaceae bacterium]|nr:dihydrolipoyl dehydrogenase [Muribaculaceae bacterium]